MKNFILKNLKTTVIPYLASLSLFFILGTTTGWSGISVVSAAIIFIFAYIGELILFSEDFFSRKSNDIDTVITPSMLPIEEKTATAEAATSKNPALNFVENFATVEPPSVYSEVSQFAIAHDLAPVLGEFKSFNIWCHLNSPFDYVSLALQIESSLPAHLTKKARYYVTSDSYSTLRDVADFVFHTKDIAQVPPGLRLKYFNTINDTFPREMKLVPELKEKMTFVTPRDMEARLRVTQSKIHVAAWNNQEIDLKKNSTIGELAHKVFETGGIFWSSQDIPQFTHISGNILALIPAEAQEVTPTPVESKNSEQQAS